jgi:hypothetical protein
MDNEKAYLKLHRKMNYGELDIAEKVLNLKLRPKQKEIIKNFFTKDEKGKPKYEEYMLVCGKKGGKTFLTACMNLILVYKLLLIEDFFKKWEIIPQDIYLLNTCAGKDQSVKVYLNQVKGMMMLSPFLKEFKINEMTDELHFRIPGYKNKIILKAQSSRSTSSLGYLCFSVTFDELAWFEDNTNKNSSKEVYGALFPNIKPFRGWGYSFILSSPSDTSSWFYSHYEFAKNSAKKMVIQHPTWVMNPGISRESLDEEFKRDYDKACMDYAAEFIENVGGAFTVDAIEKALQLDVRDVGVPDKRPRIISLDPGLKHDAYALAMGYGDENYKVRIDYVRYWFGTRSNPVKIREVEDFIRYLCKKYIVTKIVLDQRYSASTIQTLDAEGLPIFETFFDGGYKQKMYQTFKEKLNMGEVLLPRDEKVKNELVALKRKGTGASIRYEAPTSGPVKTDDVADAVANCVYQLSLLNSESEGTDDFAIDGLEVKYDDDEDKLKKMSDDEKEKYFKAKKEREEAERKEEMRIEAEGGFIID